MSAEGQRKACCLLERYTYQYGGSRDSLHYISTAKQRVVSCAPFPQCRTQIRKRDMRGCMPVNRYTIAFEWMDRWMHVFAY